MPGTLAHKGRSVAILSDNGIGLKNKVLNEVCGQLGIKVLFPYQFHSQSNVIFNGMNSYHLLVIAITYFPAAMVPNLHSSLCLDGIQQKDAYLTLTTAIDIMEPMKGKQDWKKFTNYGSITQNI